MKDFVFFDALAEALVHELDASSSRRALEGLHAFASAFEEDRSVRDALASNRLDITQAGCEKYLDKPVVNTLALLQSKGRLRELPAFIERFKRASERAGLGREASVETVVPLTAADKQSLQKKLEAHFKLPVFLRERLEPSIIGGLRIESGDWLYDATVQGKLKRLVQRIKA